MIGQGRCLVFIGDLARRTGLTVKAVRHYEAVGILPAADRTAAGYRVYDERDEQRLAFVKAARAIGLRLDDVRDILAFRDRGEAPCAYVRDLIRQEATALDQRIADMQRLRDELDILNQRAEALGTDAGGDSCICHIIQTGQGHDR